MTHDVVFSCILFFDKKILLQKQDNDTTRQDTTQIKSYQIKSNKVKSHQIKSKIKSNDAM